MYFLIFLNLADKFLEASHNDEVIYDKILTIESNLTSKLIRIVTSVILHDLNFLYA